MNEKRKGKANGINLSIDYFNKIIIETEFLLSLQGWINIRKFNTIFDQYTIKEDTM